MLRFNLKKIYRMRGIHKPMKFLQRHGFSYSKAYSLAHNRMNAVRLDNLEKLCFLLNCTPNDLLEWKPTLPEHNVENHPMLKLMPKEDFNFLEIIKDIPPEQIPEFKKSVVEAKSKLKSSST